MHTMLEELNGFNYSSYQGNQLIFSIWTGLICNLFKGNDMINMYTSEEMQNDMMMDVVLQISQNQCNLQVFRKKISARLETIPLNRRGQNYIIFAQDLADAWNVLERIWQRFRNWNGNELFLILTPTNQENSEIVHFVRKAWTQLYYFSVLVADTTLVHDSFFSVRLNVLIANPYNIVENNSESLSYRIFRFTEGSTKGDWIHMTSYLKSRVKNLNGYPIKITMRRFTLLCEPVFDNEGKITRFMGYEGTVVNEYAKIFNFTPIYNLLRYRNLHGVQAKNESVSDGLKDVEEGFSDIFGNREKLTVNVLQQSQFLKSIEPTSMVVVVPKSLPQLKIIGTLFSILDGTVSKVSIVFIVFNIMAWTVVKVKNDMVKFHKDIELSSHIEKFNALAVIVMNSVCVVSNISFQIPTSSKERIFYVGLSIWALAFTNIYIGTITTRLAVTKSSEIDTIQQLQQSGLKIGCVKDDCNEVTSEPNKENAKRQFTVRQLLAKQFFVVHNPSGIPKRIVHDRDTAVVCPSFVANSLVEETLSKDGVELVHVMKESVNEVFYSIVVRAGLPLLRPLEKSQTSLFEGGLLGQWKMSIKYEFDLKKNRTSLLGSDNAPLILDNFRLSFLLWGFFVVMSIVIFVLELICHRIKFR